MKKLLYLSFIALALFACRKNEPDDLFGGKTPEQRFEQSQAELRQELTSPQQGWKFVYHTNENFGNFVFLMKFTPEGFVSMASDVTLPGTPKSSKYEIKWGQGTLLSFTTKNYLHELSDAKKGIPGAGFAGDFEFVYFGKEGNKLKFRTQRKKTEQFVYFEPATAQDWADIETLSKNINTLEENSNKYYFKVENNGVTTYYNMEYDSRNILLTPLSDPNTTLRATVSSSKAGITFNPALTLQGKTFTELVFDNSTTSPTYKATVDGVTAEAFFSQFPPDEFVSDDYKDIPEKYNAFVILPANLKSNSYMSSDFYNNLLNFDNGKDFQIFRMDFDNNGTCEIQIAYQFTANTNSWVFLTCKYELKNKRLYLTDAGSLQTTNTAVWERAENTAIFAQARKAVTRIVELGAEGFYVKKVSDNYSGYPLYTLESKNNPTYTAPFLALKRK